jgi:hypothetical protein
LDTRSAALNHFTFFVGEGASDTGKKGEAQATWSRSCRQREGKCSQDEWMLPRNIWRNTGSVLILFTENSISYLIREVKKY